MACKITLPVNNEQVFVYLLRVGLKGGLESFTSCFHRASRSVSNESFRPSQVSLGMHVAPHRCMFYILSCMSEFFKAPYVHLPLIPQDFFQGCWSANGLPQPLSPRRRTEMLNHCRRLFLANTNRKRLLFLR